MVANSDDPPSDTSNPYAPPAADAEAATRGPRAVFAGKPRPWTTSELLREAYARVRAQWGRLAFASLLVLGVPQLPPLAPRVLFDVDAHGRPLNVNAFIAGGVVAQIVAFVLTNYFLVGSTKMWLDVARGKQADLGHLFDGLARTPAMLAGTFLLAIALAGGFVLLVIPGFIAMTGFCLMQCFIVDAKMGPIRALSASWEVTNGHRLSILGFWFASILILLIGTAVCGFGVVFAYPVVYVAVAMMYLRLSGRWRKKMEVRL